LQKTEEPVAGGRKLNSKTVISSKGDVKTKKRRHGVYFSIETEPYASSKSSPPGCRQREEHMNSEHTNEVGVERTATRNESLEGGGRKIR